MPLNSPGPVSHPGAVQIAVIGGRKAGRHVLEQAERVGELLADKKAVLICGGLGGVMEAACRGAKRKGGITIGILPGEERERANPYVDYIIPSGMGILRNGLIINSAAGAIAVGGQYGTLSEMAFALQRSIPLVSLKSWSFDEAIMTADTAEEAVKLLFQMIAERTGRRMK
jgi:uncharacterized protein (TIGR00725 family)